MKAVETSGETASSPHTISSSTLAATLDELERERRVRAEGDLRIQELEQMLDDHRVDSDNLRHSMSAKVNKVFVFIVGTALASTFLP